MESFPPVAAEVLTAFRALLEHSPPPVGSSRLLQLMAINMFAVHNSQPKGRGRPEPFHLRGRGDRVGGILEDTHTPRAGRLGSPRCPFLLACKMAAKVDETSLKWFQKLGIFCAMKRRGLT